MSTWRCLALFSRCYKRFYFITFNIVNVLFWSREVFFCFVLFFFYGGFVSPLLFRSRFAEMYFWLTLRATSRELMLFFFFKKKKKRKTEKGSRWVWPPWNICSLSSRPFTMTEPRPASVRSSLIADEVKGHKWARMDFPQLYTRVCTNTQQKNHSDIDFRQDGVISQ